MFSAVLKMNSQSKLDTTVNDLPSQTSEWHFIVHHLMQPWICEQIWNYVDKFQAGVCRILDGFQARTNSTMGSRIPLEIQRTRAPRRETLSTVGKPLTIVY